MKTQFLRTQFIVNPRLQYTFAGIVAIASLTNLIFFLTAITILENRASENLQSLDKDTKLFVASLIEDLLTPLVHGIIVFNIFTTLVSFILGAILLNHIAGPIYAITRQINHFLNGDSGRKPLTLRKHDFFKELSIAVNQLLDRLDSSDKDSSK